MPISPGKSLGPYQVQSLLGAGGMGEVYRARDSRLGREVGLKVLPADRKFDADRKQRFFREARSASALNHPNIVTIYDIGNDGGTDYIAMELIDGATLEAMIPKAGMRLADILKIGIQVADGLARAHTAGIIHRDLKPANIMVSSTGLVKILDFGLAKLTESNDTAEFLRQSGSAQPITADLHSTTQAGEILGTVTYMSPEQAEGRKLDHRSDIFSFGAVLYEMLTGQPPFRADSKLATMWAILNEDPKPPSEIVRQVPRDLEKLILRCLRKDPERRLQHLADARLALEEMKQESESGEILMSGFQLRPPPRKTPKWVYAALALALVSCAGAAVYLRGEIGKAIHRLRTPATTWRPVPITSDPGREEWPSLSPDGNQVAYVWTNPAGESDIYVRILGSVDHLRLTQDKRDKIAVRWSPDGKWIVYAVNRGESSELRLISPLGGSDRSLGLTERSRYMLGPPVGWAADNTTLIVAHALAGDVTKGLFRLSIQGGDAKLILPLELGAFAYYSPALSPDGNSLAFVRARGLDAHDLCLVALGPGFLITAKPTCPVADGFTNTGPDWTPDSQAVLFSSNRDGRAHLYRLDRDPGAAPELVPNVGRDGYEPTIAVKGSRMVYIYSANDTNIHRVLLPVPPAPPTPPENFIYSPDTDRNPAFSPDGLRIAFVSDRLGQASIWIANADGGGAAPIASAPAYDPAVPVWSPDGRRLAFEGKVDGQSEIFVVASTGGQAVRMTNHPAADIAPSWSRDGQWIYFGSARTGTDQVWKMSASGGAPVQITREGGAVAVESADASTIFYTKEPGFRRALWTIPAAGGSEAEILPAVLQPVIVVTTTGFYFTERTQTVPSATYLSFFDVTNRTTTQLVRISHTVDRGLALSPDGLTALFTAVDREDVNLMMVDNFR